MMNADRELLLDIAQCGVDDVDSQVKYVEVQVDRVTWEALQKLRPVLEQELASGRRPLCLHPTSRTMLEGAAIVCRDCGDKLIEVPEQKGRR